MPQFAVETASPFSQSPTAAAPRSHRRPKTVDFAADSGEPILESGLQAAASGDAIRLPFDIASITGQTITRDGGRVCAWQTPDMAEKA